jgi:hypothetical protein
LKLTLNLSTKGAMIALWNVAGTKTTDWLESTVNSGDKRRAEGRLASENEFSYGWPFHPLKTVLF